jgi:hypothetical protein
MPFLPEAEDWAVEEFGAADLSDARRTQRLIALARRLVQSPQCSFPKALNDVDLKAVYRFFDNKQVDPENRLGAHLEQTLTRMQPFPVVLVAQDTTECNLTHLEATKGLGYTSHVHLRGFFLHKPSRPDAGRIATGCGGNQDLDAPVGTIGQTSSAQEVTDHRERKHEMAGRLTALVFAESPCPQTQIIGVW